MLTIYIQYAFPPIVSSRAARPTVLHYSVGQLCFYFFYFSFLWQIQIELKLRWLRIPGNT